MKIYKKGITHAGIFHADDVFSTALLRIIDPEFEVKRVFEVGEVPDDCIVYDIGRERFDHHGEEVLYHENGRRYASFGLLWEEYGEYVSGSEKVKKELEESFVSVIDESDNGGDEDMVSDIISAFNPLWNSDDNHDKAFETAVDTAKVILEKLLEKEKSMALADSEVMEAYNESSENIVVLKRFAPWVKLLAPTDAEFVVFPSVRGGYNVQGVPLNSETRELKIPFPESWGGLEREELVKESGIEDLVFCHRSLFLAAAKTLEGAIEAARKAKALSKVKAIPYIIMDVKMRAASPVSLPEWMSSTIRGAIGTEMLSCLCKDGSYKCENCSENCSAGLLFSTATSDKSEEALNPYIISGDEFDGEFLKFRMTLFSTGTRAVSDVVSVLRKGLNLGSGRTHFSLESITDSMTGKTIFDGLLQLEAEVHKYEFCDEQAKCIRVDFLSPYKTKISVEKFEFEQLMRAALRRVSTVYRQLGSEPGFDYKGLISRAADVITLEKHTELFRTQRYSNRSGSKMDVTGFTGYEVFKGELSEFMPFLRIAEIIHLGKMCVMGLGEIKITVTE